MKSRIRLTLTFLALAALGSCTEGQPQLRSRALGSDTKSYTVSKLYSTLAFTATKWMVFKEEGLFEEFSGTLTYSGADPAQCKIDVTVEAASLDTRSQGRDKVLRSDDFFDVERFPTLSFHSTRVAAAGNDSYDVRGELTVHGVTKSIDVPVKLIGARVMAGIGDFVGFETTFTINRLDFGVLGNRWSGNKMAIDPTVTIHLLIGGVRNIK